MLDLNHYILKDGEPVAVPLMEWAEWLESDTDFSKRRVANTVIGNSEISTVFLCLDHRFGFGRESKPVLFETLVFGGKLDMEMERYETLEDAMRGHDRMVARVTESESAPPPATDDGNG